MSPDRSPGAESADDLRRQRDVAVARSRAVEHELGVARGEILRLQRAMWRRTRRQRRAAALWQRLRTLVAR
ncbi:MAG: hypothetical protein ACR2HQ_04220 [Ilumatobacteraceae bacterium]